MMSLRCAFERVNAAASLSALRSGFVEGNALAGATWSDGVSERRNVGDACHDSELVGPALLGIDLRRNALDLAVEEEQLLLRLSGSWTLN